MNKAQTIPPKDTPFLPNAPKHLDYTFLREEGLRHIQDLSGQLWTDHNTHDPGITILEVLCYALTDLAYRTQLPDAELFAPNPKNRKPEGDTNFPSADTMLTCNPLTELDWRKLLLDIDGIRNAWLIPIETEKKAFVKDEKGERLPQFTNPSHLWNNELWEEEATVYLDSKTKELSFNLLSADFEAKNYPLSILGVYKIQLELEPHVSDKAPILAEVHRRLAGHRNLCEDFSSVHFVEDEPLTLCAEFELDATAQPDAVMLEIFNRIEEFFSPTVSFYTLSEMLKKGRTMEEIFEGRPLLPTSHGFVDTAELEALELRKEIHVSDIYHLILGDNLTENPNSKPKIDGVTAIKKLLIINPKTDPKQEGKAWKLPITEGSRPTINIAESIRSTTFFKRDIPYQVNAARVIESFGKRLANPSKILYNKKEEEAKGRFNLDAAVPTGEFRVDVGEHISIQQEFPVVYGVGEAGLPEATPERLAQAAQLKGYLTFYDHLLANYLAQLATVRNQFSPELTNSPQPNLPSDAAEQAWLGLSPDDFTPLSPVSDLRTSIPNASELFGFAPEESVVQIGYPNKNAPKPPFAMGELIAESQSVYPTPQDRDRALRQLIADLDADLIKIQTETVRQTGELDRFRFQFVSQLSRQVVLTSVKIFDNKNTAESVAKSIHFVATLDASYTKKDDTARQQYGFQLYFSPPQYAAYLRSITEDETRFFKQKNQLFDHLLARFAEDFTDYTLLTFATLRNAGQQVDADDLALSRRFAMDKARFLKNYPSISRNRAKAMDLSQSLWTDANQTGLENRVSQLIGIADRGTKTLNYFDIAPNPTRFRFKIDSVMRSSFSFETELKATEARTNALDLLKNGGVFSPTYCEVEKVFGFRLLAADGCPVAKSVDTFGSAALRDRKMRWAKGLLEGNGLVREFRADTEGVFFEIKDNFGEKIRAFYGAKDNETAVFNFVTTLQALENADNWQPINEPSGRGFGFQVIDNQLVVAVYSGFYKTKTERNKRLTAVANYLKTKTTIWQTEQHAPRLRWQIRLHQSDGSDLVALSARHFFSTSEQAAAAWAEAKRAVLEADFGSLVAVKDALTNRFLLQILRNVEDDAPLILAQADFQFAHECTAVLEAIKEWIVQLPDGDATAADFWKTQKVKNVGAACLDTEGGHFSLNLPFSSIKKEGVLPNEELSGAPIFPNRIAALAATYAVLPSNTEGSFSIKNIAESAANFPDFPANEGCSYGFTAQNGTLELATYSPLLLDLEAVKSKITTITTAANAQKLDISLSRVVNQRWFEVMAETCDEQIVPILRGYEKQFSATEIRTFFDEFRSKAMVGLGIKDGLAVSPKSVGSLFKFVFSNNEGTISYAESIELFKTENEAKAAGEEFFKSLKVDLAKEIETYPTEPKIDGTCEGDVNTNRWRLSDADAGLATFIERDFLTKDKAEAEKCLEILRGRYACQPPFFSMVFENSGNFDYNKKGDYWYVLRDSKHFYWRSKTVFGSLSETLTAFDNEHIDVLTAAKNIQNYCTKSRKENGNTVFFIELRNSDGKTIAESVETACDTEGVNNLLGRLQTHALAYPIAKNSDLSFGFQTFNPTKKTISWVSNRSYAKATDAKAAFKGFLDLLKSRSHFRLVLSEDGCRYTIEIVEVLLDEIGTQRVKTPFIKLLKKLDEKVDETIEKKRDNETEEAYKKRVEEANEKIRKEKERIRTENELIEKKNALIKKENERIAEENEKCDWEAVENFIDASIAAGESTFVPTVDYLNCCGYGFKLADKNYRLARHPQSFHSKTDRELMRDALWQNYRCRKTQNTEGSEIGKIMDFISNDFFEIVEQTCDFKVGAKTVKQTIFKVALKDSQNTEGSKIFTYDAVFNWLETDTAISEAEVKADAENFAKQRREQLIEARRAMPNLGSWLVLTETDGSMRLGITRSDGSLILVFEERSTNDVETMKTELARLYESINFSSEITALPDGQFGFEIREKKTDSKTYTYINGFVDKNCDSIAVELPVFTVVWQQIAPFKTAQAAQTAVDKVKELLKTKENYARTEAADGSPTLEIVDPTRLIATHPRTYDTPPQRYTAWLNTRRHIHTEGMHVVEHLLLRPRVKPDLEGKSTDEIREIVATANKELLLTYLNEKGNDAVEKKAQAELDAFNPTNDDTEFDDYIMGADPYSFWATVVLPHWSARFRDLDFRDFFQRLLHRETPAHIALNIVWVNPQQMSEFEKAWRDWLEVAQNPTHCAYQCRKLALVEVLKQLKTITPEAGLLDCTSGAASQLIYLEKTTLR